MPAKKKKEFKAFPKVLPRPSKSKIKKKEGRRGTKYKLDSNTQFSIGNGGVQLNFDLLNGDVTIKE